MKRQTLKKLLDKRKTINLLKEFLKITPEFSACWVVDKKGKCFSGYPNMTKENFYEFVEKVSESGNTIMTSPYIGSPIFVNDDLAGIVVAQSHGEDPPQNLLQALRFLCVSLTQFAIFGIEKRDIIQDALDKYREITLLYTIGETISSSLEVDQIAQLILETNRTVIETESSSVMLLNPETKELEIRAALGGEHDVKAYFKEGEGIAGLVVQTGKPQIVNDTETDSRFVQLEGRNVRSLLCVPLKVQERVLGVINLSNKLPGGMFIAGDEKLLMTLGSQAAVCIANAQNYEKIKQKNIAFKRFVPTEFLRYLGKEEVEDINLGEVSKEELSVLFSDIRSFTSLSETMTPDENFRFLNNYLRYIGPMIESNGGFIDKYIGDAIMALFSGNNAGVADDAVAAAVGMIEKLSEYNQHRHNAGYLPIAIGIGIHTGPLMLGTIGFETRMESTVIGDTVNLASRMEGLTKQYGISIGITETTFQRLFHPASYLIREIDTVQVKGKEHAITLYEVFNGNPDRVREQKIHTLDRYHEALSLYKERKWRDAIQLFIELQTHLEADKVIEIYLERCRSFLNHPPDESWNGITRLHKK